jgi:hypothetical protein
MTGGQAYALAHMRRARLAVLPIPWGRRHDRRQRPARRHGPGRSERAMQIRMIHNGRDRDSLLMPMEPTSVDLMLQYSIQLVRCEPTSHFNVAGTYCTGNGRLHDQYGLFHLDPWTDTEWNDFRNNFIGVIMRYWDGKFELTPSRPWFQALGQQANTPAKVACSLSLGLVDSPARANQRYFIIKPRETGFRSFAWAERRLGLFTHRDLAYEWNTRMTRVGHTRVRHSVSYLQSTVLHEFGHTLGLDHVNGAGNSDANYGVTLDQRDDLMGMGDHATGREAQPWKTQLRHHILPGSDRAPLRFTARVIAPQLITYWDNDWRPPAAPAAPAH